MNVLESAHQPGSRLRELSPFAPETADGTGAAPQDLRERESARIAGLGSFYGCVEWFQYLDHPWPPAADTGGQASGLCAPPVIIEM